MSQNARTNLIVTGRDYLTRRIRRQVDGSDLDKVFEKQITMPIAIPYDLEQSLVQIVSDALEERGLSDGRLDQFLIPIHEQGKGTAIIPDLQDTAGPTGNIRFWVINNELMWAGIDRRIDEVFEILWALFHWHNSAMAPYSQLRLDQGDALAHFATSFRQRLPPQTDASTSEASEPMQDIDKEHAPVSLQSTKWKGLTPREAVLFRRWAFYVPIAPNRTYNDQDQHPLFGEDEDILYPFPDDLFWDDGDEGDRGCDGVPQWHNVVPEDEHEDAGEDKDESRKRKRESSGSTLNLVVQEK